MLVAVILTKNIIQGGPSPNPINEEQTLWPARADYECLKHYVLNYITSRSYFEILVEHRNH